ncbi:hypothetical protein Ae201684P_019574 [Aphanomyces euteiches]|uniref:Integrase catalytic domain-containing protein n=1 Tax=Aphanomyces euteiches TaxID=100861 RepID=A0A6G0XE63_9STRA|nr:hypothetical protein Ae201684_005638 [Aphanomyces euteiches]KAH9078489.1 hypothetical protein Ae201684P_019574 [Aphanomyces euteiches]
MILCSLSAPLPETCTVLIEPIVKSPIQVARSLNQPRLSQTWVQIRNAGDSPFTCLPGDPIGTNTLLPNEFEELSNMPDPHSTKVTDSDPTPVQPTHEPVNTAPAISSLHPNYIASIQTNPFHNELPINWEGSTLNPTQREMLRKILLQHDIFVTTSKAPGRTDLVKCYINTGSAPPIKQAPYRVSQREGEIMEAEIQQYLELGLICPSTSPWASLALIIRKPDGSIRFCIDYGQLNDVTIKDSYPLPRIDDLLDVLGNAKYFSTMDVASAYWNFTVLHRPGQSMGCADGLSRLPISMITRSAAARAASSTAHATTTPLEPPASTSSEQPTLDLDPDLPPYTDDSYQLPLTPLARAQAGDPFVVAMKAYIQDSAIPTDPSMMTLVTRSHDQYAVQGNILYRRCILKTPIRNPELQLAPVIPLAWTKRILQLCHDSTLAGHFGVSRTIDRVRRVAYWQGWRSDVHEYCRVCVRCGAAKGSRPWRQGQLQRMPVYLLRGPFNFLVVDALGPFPITPRNNRYVLIFIDYFTRWPEAFAVPDLKTSTFTRVLVDEVLCRYGVPERLLSDRGTNFVSELAHSIYKVLGIDKLSSAAGHPQSQGLVERFNSTLATMLKMYINSVQTDWELYLPRLLWAYRTAYHETLGDTPYFCLFGRDPISPLHLTFLNQDTPWRSDDLPQWCRHQASWFQTTRRLVESQLIKGQNRDQRQSRQRAIDFQPADSVWVYQYFRKSRHEDDLRISKLAYHWHGPYRTLTKQGSNTYRVYLPSQPDRDFRVNVDRLKLFQGYWSRPYDDDIPDRLLPTSRDEDDAISPGEPAGTSTERQTEPDSTDLTLTIDRLPTSSFTNRVTFNDNDVAYTNTESPIKIITDKRWIAGKEIEYHVTHADDTQHWTPRSRLQDYQSFIQEFEDTHRNSQGLPPLRRSARLAELDLAPEPPPSTKHHTPRVSYILHTCTHPTH